MDERKVVPPPMQLHRVACSNIPVLEDMRQRLVIQTQSTSCMARKAISSISLDDPGANLGSYTGIHSKDIHDVG